MLQQHGALSFYSELHLTTPSGKRQGKKEKKKKRSFPQSKKEANCAFVTAGLISGITFRREAGTIQETAVQDWQEISSQHRKCFFEKILIMALLSQSILCCTVITGTKLQRGLFLKEEVVLQTHEQNPKCVYRRWELCPHNLSWEKRDKTRQIKKQERYSDILYLFLHGSCFCFFLDIFKPHIAHFSL